MDYRMSHSTRKKRRATKGYSQLYNVKIISHFVRADYFGCHEMSQLLTAGRNGCRRKTGSALAGPSASCIGAVLLDPDSCKKLGGNAVPTITN
jgi:hypothetical protein